MNKTFKTVWNQVRRCYVAVNEKVKGAAQRSSAGGVLSLSSSVVGALPTVIVASSIALTSLSTSAEVTDPNKWTRVYADATVNEPIVSQWDEKGTIKFKGNNQFTEKVDWKRDGNTNVTIEKGATVTFDKRVRIEILGIPINMAILRTKGR